MSLFLTAKERALIDAQRGTAPLNQFYWALLNRAERRAAKPGLTDRSATSDWWHFAAEYLTDGAMAYALKPSPTLSAWVRDVTLSLARRPVTDWVGPWFRAHGTDVPVGHLETAHLSWAVAVALDLAGDVFTEAERAELVETLREKGLTLCKRWLERNNHLANWRCVLNAGIAVAGAVLDDAESMELAAHEYRLLLNIFQPDGTYAEGLQYGNYAGYTLMLAREALTRRNPALAAELPMKPYALKPRWDAYSLFYTKPLAGWGAYPLPRFANFNDCAALFRPTSDLLLHIAAHAREEAPQEAGLARWLFDQLYTPYIDREPRDRATFGFVTDFGFLTLPLLPQAGPALSPQDAGLPLVAGFSCGDSVARDEWGGRTVLAVHGGGDPVYGPGHLHGDLNSFILVHNQERLLVDPGHSCYRNLIHEVECSTFTHNTCTFSVEPEGGLGLQEELFRARTLQQSRTARRLFDAQTREPGQPADRGGRRLLLAHAGPVAAFGSEAARLYGPPLEEFARFWFLCGAHALFVVDHIVAAQPVKTTWHWVLNNRDSTLDLKPVLPDRLVARRGFAGLKIFHLGGGAMGGPAYGHVHDAYHSLPNQLGEGKPGSGLIMNWTERQPAHERTVTHAFAVDDSASIAGWHLRQSDGVATLEGPAGGEVWSLAVEANPLRFTLRETVSGQQYRIGQTNGAWQLEAQ